MILAVILMIMPVPRTDCPRAQETTPQGEADSTETEPDPAGEPGPVRVAIELEGGGTIVMEMLEEEAPVTVDRFLTLVSEGFYDGLKFHRVEKFLVQTGKKEHEYPPIEGEMFGQIVTHEAGMVGMARLPDDYDSGSTQFYIMKKHKPTFNCEYTLFARVTDGMALVKNIDKDTKIERVFIVE
ncbi:MAG TPA: peptidylprolyl isomerase [Candidatus Krumholzibacterium sp.]|nr:peptidylprolyl isomerase [Candidatus Krumholzibacterium sp.]